MTSLRNRLLAAFVTVVLVNLTGCATFEFAKPAPPQTSSVTVKPSGEELSGMSDLPIGVYRVPESHVIISGHQKGGGAGLLFGLIGVAVQHAVNASAGEEAVKDAENKIRIKLDGEVEASVQRVLAASPSTGRFTQQDNPGSTRLLITPGLVLSYVSDTDIRPYLVLKTKLQDPASKTLWETRYIASTGTARPLLGENGWLQDDALKTYIASNLDLAIRVMLGDVENPHPRDEAKLTMIQANFPYVRERLQTNGFLLFEDDAHLALVPKVGDVMTFAGVNIFDKSVVVYRPATKDDPFLDFVKEKEQVAKK